MYQVIINDKETVKIEKGKEGFISGEQSLPMDLRQIDEHNYHVLYKSKSYNLEVRKTEDKKYQVKINGKLADVQLKDKLDLLLEKLGLDLNDAGKLSVLKAPMPGLIVDIKVAPGDEVKKGDQLMILEAMKMENVLKSPGEGVVKSINVKKGDGVEKNQVLIQF